MVFATCELNDVDMILSPMILDQLSTLNEYEVIDQVTDSGPLVCGDVKEITVDAVTTRSQAKVMCELAEGDTPPSQTSADQESGQQTSDLDGVVDLQPNSQARDTFIVDQHSDPTFARAWDLAKEQKGGFFIKDGILFHLDLVLGVPVNQVCLPSGRLAVCELAHHPTHQGVRKTVEHVRTNFYWDGLTKFVKYFVSSCLQCQTRARITYKDRIPITVVPRDPIPYRHLYCDIIGPMFENVATYCFTVIDSCTRFPFAFPLKSETSQAICDCLLQIFSLVGVATEITFDQASYFTSELSHKFLALFGCTPRFSTVLHPEGNALVERLNQTLKRMMHHLSHDNPKQWHKLLPLALWTIRESENVTLGVSPFVMTWRRHPTSPLKMLADSWTSDDTVITNSSQSVPQYLAEMQENLAKIHKFVDEHATQQQQKYVAQYNKRAKFKRFKLGDQVMILLMQKKLPF